MSCTAETSVATGNIRELFVPKMKMMHGSTVVAQLFVANVRCGCLNGAFE